jgi:hypothetical protein
MAAAILSGLLNLRGFWELARLVTGDTFASAPASQLWLYGLCDPTMHILTGDGGITKLVKNSPQRCRRSADHPGHDVLERMYSERLYPGPRDVFATNMLEANRLVIGPLLDRLKSAQGHVVIRVDPGGDTFRVIILDDSAENYRVKAIYGPYHSR